MILKGRVASTFKTYRFMYEAFFKKSNEIILLTEEAENIIKSYLIPKKLAKNNTF